MNRTIRYALVWLLVALLAIELHDSASFAAAVVIGNIWFAIAYLERHYDLRRRRTTR